MAADYSDAVDMSDRDLAEIPEEALLKWKGVVTLNLSRNPWIRLNGFLRFFKDVRVLMLEQCGLCELPDDIYRLSKIEELYLSFNPFSKDFKSDIRQLRLLKKLCLRGCQLGASVTLSFGDLEKLEELDLAGCSFPKDRKQIIGPLPGLKKLNLSRCGLTTVPESLGDMQKLVELDLSNNRFSASLDQAIKQLRTLKKLDLGNCGFQVNFDLLIDLDQLEELYLYSNDFAEGVSPAVGRLCGLRKLDLGRCGLSSVPDSLEELKVLEELYLYSNFFSHGINSSVGRLRQLRKLDLGGCGLSTLPDSLGDLKTLKELYLSGNIFSDRLNPVLGQLLELRTLDLRKCGLTTVPDWLAKLTLVDELNLSSNHLHELHTSTMVLPPKVEVLDLSECELRAVPDWFEDLKKLTVLKLSCNKLIQYPACVLLIKNLVHLDVSNKMSGGSVTNGNCIRNLPVELAFSRLHVIKLEGNPITEPPEEIWTQGLDAIKSFILSTVFQMPADTVNVLGYRGAGKTSVAQSLVARLPWPATGDSRTSVMVQSRIRIGETSGHCVAINDFGGYQIHVVMPLFLPASGLCIIVVDILSHISEQIVQEMLTTIFAMCRVLRIVVVGTHADKILNAGERSSWEQRMLAFTQHVVQYAAEEVNFHIQRFCCRPNNISEQKLEKLHQLMSNLRSAAIRVVTLSCVVFDEGLSKLHGVIAELLSRPEFLPLRWYRIGNEVLRKVSNGFYATVTEVENIARVYFSDENDSEALKTILRYLAKTSQIIWVEDHPYLQQFIFHVPWIINVCKTVLHRDSQFHFRLNWRKREYNNGILHESLLLNMLEEFNVKSGVGKEQIVADAVSFHVINILEHFNIISHFDTMEDGRLFLIPSMLPVVEPMQLPNLKQIEKKCVNRVSVRLSFIGSIPPMSYFETNISALLRVAGQLLHSTFFVGIWNRGLIATHDGVYFLARLHDTCIALTAFSRESDVNPWTVLQPMLRCLNENAVFWHGAPPFCSIKCPWCVRHREGESDVGEIPTDLPTLAGLEQGNDFCRRCSKCIKLIPRSLCFPPDSHGPITKEEREEILRFFEKNGGED